MPFSVTRRAASSARSASPRAAAASAGPATRRFFGVVGAAPQLAHGFRRLKIDLDYCKVVIYRIFFK